MAQSHNKLNDLSELTKFVDDFIDKANSFETNETQSFEAELIDEISLDVRTLNKNKYQITFVDGLKSFQVSREFFTNKIQNHRISNVLHDCIKNILLLEDKVIEVDQIPIQLIDEVRSDRLIDSASPTKKTRYRNILSLKGVNLDRTIVKASYKNVLNSQLQHNIPKDLLRVYYRKFEDKNIIDIILLDIHHLLATSESEYKPKYRKYRDYSCCIRQLL